MRQVMLANDDFGIDSELAGTSKNFDDAACWRCAAARVTQHLNIHDRAIQIVHAGNFSRAKTDLIRTAEAQLLPEPGSELTATRDLDFVLDASVVGQHHVALRAVSEQANDRGVRAVENPNDAAFGALPGRPTGPALHFHEDVIAMHGIFDGVARDEDVAVQLWHGGIGHDKPVAVLMENEPAGDLVSIGERGLLRRRSILRLAS